LIILQICSSDFISNRWLEGLFNFTIDHSIHRAVLSAHFKLLQSFCQSSNNTLIYSIDNFYANQFISVNLLTQNQFTNQIQSSIQDFQTQTIGSFQRNLASIIDITLGNQLMSAYETNWYFIPDPDGNYPIYTKSRSYRKIETILLLLIKIILFSFLYNQVIVHVVPHNHYIVSINSSSMTIQQYLECLLVVYQ
jgi:hypothetical protein